MADQQQLDLLLDLLSQGVEAWNASRMQHPDIPLDLSGANFSGASLSRAYLSRANLSGAVRREVA